MNETSLSIPTQETPLLQDDSAKVQPRIKNLKAKINFLVRILIVLVVGLLILYSIYSKNKRPEPLSPYHSALSDYYCHLTRHPKLCRDSMSSMIANATALDSNPAQIFTASLQLVADRLNLTAVAITEAAARSNSSTVGPRLSACEASVSDSLSRLSRSLELLGVDYFFESWVQYLEERNVRDEVIAVRNSSRSCLRGLREIDEEEVKLGVEKASRLADNFISLFGGRYSVLNDYYNRYYFVENESYNFLYNSYFYFHNFYGFGYGFDYAFMVCLFCAVYLFLGLLYFLFWQGN